MSKQDAQKTAVDRDEEQRLLKKMMEIIDERNDIIENMIQDENKYDFLFYFCFLNFVFSNF